MNKQKQIFRGSFQNEPQPRRCCKYGVWYIFIEAQIWKQTLRVCSISPLVALRRAHSQGSGLPVCYITAGSASVGDANGDFQERCDLHSDEWEGEQSKHRDHRALRGAVHLQPEWPRFPPRHLTSTGAETFCFKVKCWCLLPFVWSQAAIQESCCTEFTDLSCNACRNTYSAFSALSKNPFLLHWPPPAPISFSLSPTCVRAPGQRAALCDLSALIVGAALRLLVVIIKSAPCRDGLHLPLFPPRS